MSIKVVDLGALDFRTKSLTKIWVFGLDRVLRNLSRGSSSNYKKNKKITLN